jgi:hypothetical protein
VVTHLGRLRDGTGPLSRFDRRLNLKRQKRVSTLSTSSRMRLY